MQYTASLANWLVHVDAAGVANWALDEQPGMGCAGAASPADTMRKCQRQCEYDRGAACRARTTATLWFARWKLLVRLLREGLLVRLLREGVDTWARGSSPSP
eukprot:gene3862-18593_t